MNRTRRRPRATGVQLLVAAIFLTALVTTIGPAQGAYPGTNGRIAFETTRDGNLEIYSMNPDGSDEVNLTNDPAEDTDPVWSPDGTRIAFVKASEGHDNIWVMNADGTGQTNLTPGAVTTGQANEGTNPTWSPDGALIAYASSQGDIWVMNANGTNKVNLTDTVPSAGVEIQPAWSPDGTRIAYIRGADIWVMDADGGDQTQLTMTTGALQDEKAPDWSPDGSQIVYGKGSSVWRMDADGTDQVQVVANSVLPAWSPDGTRIVFSSSSFGAPNGPDIFTVDPDGTDVSPPLTGAPFIDNDPNWQPLAIPPTTTTSSPSTTSTSSTSTTSTTSTTTTSTSSTTSTTTLGTSTTVATSTTSPPTTTAPTTTPTTPTTLSNLCRRILDSQRRFNAVLDAQQAEILVRTLDPRVRMLLLAMLQAARAEGNAQFNRQLAANGCLTTPTTPSTTTTVPPTTTTVPPTTTTTTTAPPTTTAPSTTIPPSQSLICAQIRQAQQRFNAELDAREREILSRNLAPSVRIALLAQLAAARAQGNAEFNRLLATRGCVPGTFTAIPASTTTRTLPGPG